MNANTSPQIAPKFVPLIAGLRAFGIGRSRGWQLLNAGLIETFLIGNRRFVMVESLQSLPERAAGITHEQLLQLGRERREARAAAAR